MFDLSLKSITASFSQLNQVKIVQFPKYHSTPIYISNQFFSKSSGKYYMRYLRLFMSLMMFSCCRKYLECTYVINYKCSRYWSKVDEPHKEMTGFVDANLKDSCLDITFCKVPATKFTKIKLLNKLKMVFKRHTFS